METIRGANKEDIVASDSWRAQTPDEALTLLSRHFFDNTIFRSERHRILTSACFDPNTPPMRDLFPEADTEMKPVFPKLDDHVRDCVAKHPIGQLGERIDLTQSMLYLASDDSILVTRTQLAIDGGHVAQRGLHQ